MAENNTTFRLKDVKELTYAAFGKITIEPIIIDFCDDDSDDDTGWSIIILSIIDREKCKNRINVTLKPIFWIFGTCVCQFIKV